MARFRHQKPSSSNSSPCRCRYDVFLSFRGKDTRKTFTDHLYAAFVEKGFPTFRDKEEVERGEGIKPELQKAIQQSRSSVIVFSKDYASSGWCLDELVFILEHKRISSDHVVLPVFYDVDPSHLRNQTGRVGEAFSRHEENQQSPNKIKQWRVALREVADLSGMVLKNQANG
ncbi:PREDICTED: toll/interleukin-1 receptor-like protein [Prunus mume]|nr:PREDICTED: toll/interleukin-1 receptor-like protein [Prunus mume]